MIPRKIPARDFPTEYGARADRRLDPATLRPGQFDAPAHPEPSAAVPEAPAAELALPEGLAAEHPEAMKRAPITGDAEARATHVDAPADKEA